MDEPFEVVYFNWLYSKIADPNAHTPSTTYWNLMTLLHTTEFVWLVLGDDNRAEDGIDLRHEFEHEIRENGPEGWMDYGCSVLEMLIAFSRKAEFQTDFPARQWFWKLLENLDIHECNDAKKNIERRVGSALERLVWRTYRPHGQGGLFPLVGSTQDQTKVEIWYQFSEYIDDQQPF